MYEDFMNHNEEEPSDIILEVTESVLKDVRSLAIMSLKDMEASFLQHIEKRKEEHKKNPSELTRNRLRVSETTYFDYNSAFQIYMNKFLQYLDGYQKGCKDAMKFADEHSFDGPVPEELQFDKDVDDVLNDISKRVFGDNEGE
jgi:hypothetical protein